MLKEEFDALAGVESTIQDYELRSKLERLRE